jgi:hypothetical protein
MSADFSTCGGDYLGIMSAGAVRVSTAERRQLRNLGYVGPAS